MTTFDDREKSFERKFAMDEELKFKSEQRRNKLLGEWAAGKLGLTGCMWISWMDILSPTSVLAQPLQQLSRNLLNCLSMFI